MLMIAYTAWDSLQAIAQQYDADLVLAPGERLRLMSRRSQFAPRATMHRLGKQLRAGLAALQVQAPAGRRA
jgi:2-hydroxychromene-2-carboxylate isomerase